MNDCCHLIVIQQLAENVSCRSSHEVSTWITEVIQTPEYELEVEPVFQTPSKDFVDVIPSLRDGCEI